MKIGDLYFSFTNSSLFMLLTLSLVLLLIHFVTKKGGGTLVPNAWQSLVELISNFVFMEGGPSHVRDRRGVGAPLLEFGGSGDDPDKHRRQWRRVAEDAKKTGVSLLRQLILETILQDTRLLETTRVGHISDRRFNGIINDALEGHFGLRASDWGRMLQIGKAVAEIATRGAESPFLISVLEEIRRENGP